MASANFKVIPKRVTAESSTPYHLSPEQLQFYRDNGYLLIKKLIGIPALNSYRQRFTDICEGRVEKDRVVVIKDLGLAKPHVKAEDYINKLMLIHFNRGTALLRLLIQELLLDDVFSTYSEDPRLLHIVTQLIGEDLTAINLMLINKPPGTSEHPPHQDYFYFPFRPADKILATWTAVDPVNRDNGCLYMVPGSHKTDVLYEHKEEVNATKLFFYGIVNSDEAAPEHSRVYFPMEPGDTMFFQSNIVHGSRPNVTKLYRKAITCHYANSSCHYIELQGTHLEEIANKVEAEFRRKGGDISYLDMWRAKTKQVKGVRSNL